MKMAIVLEKRYVDCTDTFGAAALGSKDGLKNAQKYLGRKMYTGNGFREMIDSYMRVGGQIHQITEDTVGFGTFIMAAAGYMYTVVEAVHMGGMNVVYKMRRYNRLPKKWTAAIEAAEMEG